MNESIVSFLARSAQFFNDTPETSFLEELLNPLIGNPILFFYESIKFRV